jgi:hypothetical protein
MDECAAFHLLSPERTEKEKNEKIIFRIDGTDNIAASIKNLRSQLNSYKIPPKLKAFK